MKQSKPIASIGDDIDLVCLKECQTELSYRDISKPKIIIDINLRELFLQQSRSRCISAHLMPYI